MDFFVFILGIALFWATYPLVAALSGPEFAGIAFILLALAACAPPAFLWVMTRLTRE